MLGRCRDSASVCVSDRERENEKECVCNREIDSYNEREVKENESVCVKRIKNERASSMCKRKRIKIN